LNQKQTVCVNECWGLQFLLLVFEDQQVDLPPLDSSTSPFLGPIPNLQEKYCLSSLEYLYTKKMVPVLEWVLKIHLGWWKEGLYKDIVVE
jgi:hypothetical protein